MPAVRVDKGGATLVHRAHRLRQFSITHNKIAPIYRCTRELIARRPRIRKTRPPFVEMWVGISAEERDKRCKPSREPWITNRWPLRELGLSRLDCERWLLERYGRVVSKSDCVDLAISCHSALAFDETP